MEDTNVHEHFSAWSPYHITQCTYSYIFSRLSYLSASRDSWPAKEQRVSITWPHHPSEPGQVQWWIYAVMWATGRPGGGRDIIYYANHFLSASNRISGEFFIFSGHNHVLANLPVLSIAHNCCAKIRYLKTMCAEVRLSCDEGQTLKVCCVSQIQRTRGFLWHCIAI